MIHFEIDNDTIIKAYVFRVLSTNFEDGVDLRVDDGGASSLCCNFVNNCIGADEIAGKVKTLKGAAGHPAIYSPAFSLVKASIEFTQLAVADDNDWESLNKALQKIRRAFNKVHTVLDREEY